MCSLPGHPVCKRNQVCFIQTARNAKPSNNFNLDSKPLRKKRYDWEAMLQNPIFRSLVLSDEKYCLDKVSNAYWQFKDLERVLVRIVGKSLFIYPKCFSASSCSAVFCILRPSEMKCCHLSKKMPNTSWWMK